MNFINPKSCVIVGEGALPTSCGDILLRRGFSIKGFLSKDKVTRSWATKNGIPNFDNLDQLNQILINESVDFLFSIVNPNILPDEILRKIRIRSINYHDAPLPRYAGVHAIPWALLSSETAHGITWHHIDTGVDTGDIICQELISIDDEDTSFSLNLKCFEVACQSFEIVLNKLSAPSYNAIPQDRTQRTYFTKYERPYASCILNWKLDAAILSRQLRALDFGGYTNVIGLSKIFIEGHYFLVPNFEILNSSSTAVGGTLLDISDDFIVISTNTNDVKLSQVLNMDGVPIPMGELVKLFDLRPGYLLTLPDQRILDHLHALYCRSARAEAFWVEQFSNYPLTQFYGKRSCDKNVQNTQSYSIQLPDSSSSGHSRDEYFSIFLAFVARYLDLRKVCLGIIDAQLLNDFSGFENIFSAVVPFGIELDEAMSFIQIHEKASEKLQKIRKKGSYTRDIRCRYPELQKAESPKIVFSFLDNHLPQKDGSLIIQIDAKRKNVIWNYNAEMFDISEIKHLANLFVNLVREVIEAPSKNVFALPLLCGEEVRYQIETLNQTQEDYPRNTCIHRMFEAQVLETPSHMAVYYEGQSLTYSELNNKANQLAYYLKEQGVKADDLIGLCVERGLGMMIAVMGILKAGAAYVPLDPNYPENRLSYMVENSSFKQLITEVSLTDKVAKLIGEGSNIHVTVQDDDEFQRKLTHYPTSDLPRDSQESSRQLAYVIYTSGSTGLPKGVMVEHRGAINLAQYQRRMFAVNNRSRVIGFASLSFDAATSEWLMAWLSGAALFVCTAEQRADVEALEKYLFQHDITHATLPPALLKQMTVRPDYAIESLVLAGEASTEQLVAPWLEHYRVFNAYGPTETTVCATAIELQAQQPITIGHGISNFELYVLDHHLNVQPLGKIGELYIGGEGLARGYLNRPELTAERFIDNPFDTKNIHSSSKLYKTGDLVRYLEDGNLEYIGRTDDQVKIRGFRIELGEIESQILKQGECAAVVAIAREDVPGDKQLVVYVVPKDEAIADDEIQSNALQSQLIKRIISHLQNVLPDYMVPSHCVVLKTFPLTPNGKIDKKKLPAANSLLNLEKYVAPSSDTEKRLTTIWSELFNLPIEKIGVHTNFFALGGHSLLSAKLKLAIKREFDKSIQIADISQYSEIQLLADRIDSIHESGGAKVVQISSKQKYYLASFKQKTDWMSNQISLRKDYPSLVCRICHSFPKIQISILKDALSRLIQRYEILRTDLVVVDNELKQQINDEISYAGLFEVIDLSHEFDTVELVDWIQRRPFTLKLDFAKAPLFDVKIYRGADGDVLLLEIDHVCGDHQFFSILMKDLLEIYSSIEAKKEPNLGKIELDFKSYAQWEHEQINGANASNHLNYWLGLIGASSFKSQTRLFSDFNPPFIYSYRQSLASQINELGNGFDPYFYSNIEGSVVSAYNAPQASATYYFAVYADEFEKLKTVCANIKVPLSAMVISCLHIWLRKLTDLKQTMLAIVSEGRIYDEFLNVGGCLINNTFSVVDFENQKTIFDLVYDVQKQVVESSDHKIYPFSKLLSELDVSIEALGLIEMNYFNETLSEIPKVEDEHQEGGFGGADINITIVNYRDGLRFHCNYKKALFTENTVQLAVQYLKKIIEVVASADVQFVNELPPPPDVLLNRRLSRQLELHGTL